MTNPVHLLEPLPGFAEQEYTLDPIDPGGLIYSLRAVQRPELRFVLAWAPAFFPEYRPELSSALAEPLGSDEVDLFVMLTLGGGLDDATANLRAPIAVARETRRGIQVILEDSDLSMREPLVTH
jgi:flagellar assembly factor FliW